MVKKKGFDVVATNRQASYRYFIGEKWEAGIALLGPEVKSLRDRRVSLKESFCRVLNNEAWLFNMHIAPWAPARGGELDPTRSRKLLLHRSEIAKLIGGVDRKGFALIPLRVYFKRGKAKVEIALCQGKRLFDKRQSIKRKIHKREMERAQVRVRKGK